VEFTGYAGVSRIEIKTLTQTKTDPVIAALLGVSESLQIVHALQYSPTFAGRISWLIRRGIVHASVSRGFTPGNGLFAASSSTAVLGGDSYTGLRRWSASVQGSFNDSRSLTGLVGKYRSTSAGITLSRKIIGAAHFVSQYSARVYDSPDFSRYRRVVHEGSIGIGFTPGEIPLRIW